MLSFGDRSPGYIFTLPPELITSITSLLSNYDIKSFRLTCRRLQSVAHLRLDRVFLSPNPRNVDVCNAIANHEVLRHMVTEIVYDDARLVDSFQHGDVESEIVDDSTSAERVPDTYSSIYHQTLVHLKMFGGNGVETVAKNLAARLPPKESYALYCKLLQQQQRIIDTSADEMAFSYALKRFPSLRRVTLTPGTHGEPMFPLYQTPMIRELPLGFIYPIPQGWSMPIEKYSRQSPLGQWKDEKVKERWRGFCLVTRVLARCQSNNISEFVIDSKQLPTGLNCRFLDEADGKEYRDMVTLFRRTSMSSIELSLAVRGQDGENWPRSRTDQLCRLLGEVVNLRHISISTNANVDTGGFISLGTEPNFIPLRTIFPIDTWMQLRHFGLSRFYVKQADLSSFIAALPQTLRSIELSFLVFIEYSGNYRGLLCDMRQNLGWGERPVSQRPRVIIRVDPEFGPGMQMFVEVNDEVDDFLYHDGDNPFEEDDGDTHGGGRISTGIGFKRYVCNPAKDQSNTAAFKQTTLGIV